jgi:ubiquinone/menaquinone biosynthesis C-methylase UbiE
MDARPETIENRWDILYRDYPEVYEEFASVPYSGPGWVDIAQELFDLRGKVVADIGSGTGKSTFQLSRLARHVIGIEPENAMREVAIRTAKELGIENAEFRAGAAESIPLDARSADGAVAVTLASLYSRDNVVAFVREAERIVASGGFILTTDIAPGWYGGDLAPVILGESRESEPDDVRDITLEELGFDYKDCYQTQEYGSVEKIVATYGFIFGKRAIDYLRKHRKTTIEWKARIRYKWA